MRFIFCLNLISSALFAIFFSVFFSVSQPAEAYIPPAKMILSRLAENNGNGVYQIEQELQFSVGSDTLTIRETWITAGEKGLKVVAVGQNELKDKFYFQALYSGGLKWTVGNGPGNRPQKESQKIPLEMSERPFHIRSSETMAQWLTSLEILPGNFWQLKPYVKEKENFTYGKEPFLRLGRTAGAVTYVFGASPTENAGKNLPGLWIEQDLFHTRKVRWPSESELTVEELETYTRNLVFPKQRTLHWGNQMVQIQTLSVVGKPPATQPLQLLNLDAGRANTPEGLIQKEVLTEFYKRFR